MDNTGTHEGHIHITTPLIVDSKGRPDVSEMSEREMIEEIVTSQRHLSDMVEGFMATMETNPMMKMFAGKFGK